MGDVYAQKANINFAFPEALYAARDLWALAGQLQTKHDSWVTEEGKVVDGWVGGHRDKFENKRTTQDGNVDTIAGALQTLATTICTKWAEAWGEQDRINHARHVHKNTSDDGWLENAGEWIAGEDEQGGPPPGNPSTPSVENGFSVTRQPMYPEEEGRDRNAITSTGSSTGPGRGAI